MVQVHVYCDQQHSDIVAGVGRQSSTFDMLHAHIIIHMWWGHCKRGHQMEYMFADFHECSTWHVLMLLPFSVRCHDIEGYCGPRLPCPAGSQHPLRISVVCSSVH